MRQIQAQTLTSETIVVNLEHFPDACPRCHTSVSPVFVAARADRSSAEVQRIEAVFQCTRLECMRTFLGTYSRSEHPNPAPHIPFFALGQVGPAEPKEAAFDEVITSLSPSFVRIFNQALAAESMNLDQLTGIALRKALEFLVKDFAIKESPADSKAILQMPLAKCIDTYISDASVKECAKRASWLGNDETHYLRKWEDRDVSDLKILIQLTENGIKNVLLARKFIAEMPASKSASS